MLFEGLPGQVRLKGDWGGTTGGTDMGVPSVGAKSYQEVMEPTCDS